MNLMRLFARRKSELPPGVPGLLAKSDQPEAVLSGIDKLLTENQVRLEKLRQEAFKLEATRAAEVAKVERGAMGERVEALILDQIGRIETTLSRLDGEMRIVTRNLETLSKVEGRIREVQAMALKGFSEEQIEAIILDHAEKKERYLETVGAADVDDDYDPLAQEQEAKRAELKRKILAQQSAREAALPEATARETDEPDDDEADPLDDDDDAQELE